MTIYAQNNYRPGIIITNENDTIRGLIDYRTDEINSKQCRFKKDMNSDDKVFHPGDIKAYKFDDGKYYVTQEADLNKVTSKLFLEFLVKGIANLYYCKSGEQEYYFFEDEQGKIVSYTKEAEKLNDKGYYVKDNKYKGLIRYYFQDHQSIAKQAYKMKFDQKSFIGIAKKYHDEVCTSGEECIVYVNNKPDESEIVIKYSIFAGIQQSTYVFKLNEKRSYSSKNFAPTIGGQISIINPRWSKSFAAQVEFAVSQFKDKTKNIPNKAGSSSGTYYHRLDYKAINLSPKLGLKYIYAKHKIRPTIGIGVVYSTLVGTSGKHITIYGSENTLRSSNYKLKKNHFGYYVNLGTEYCFEDESSIFIRFALENYIKGDAAQWNGGDKIKTPNIVVGYTF